MLDITISGRNVTVTDAMKDYVNEKIGAAVKVFDIKPMTLDVVLRVNKNRSNPDNQICEVTVFIRDVVVRVECAAHDMYAAIDGASEKVARQIRKYKTKVIDHHVKSPDKKTVHLLTREEMDALLEPVDETDEENEHVRVKYIDLQPLTEEEALVQTDLIGHDFFVYIDKVTGLTNVVYHRHDGGYGILKPMIEEMDD